MQTNVTSNLLHGQDAHPAGGTTDVPALEGNNPKAKRRKEVEQATYQQET